MMVASEILKEKGVFSLPSLPFKKTDLEPLMSSETFDYHFEKHHKTYIDNLNNLIKGTQFEGKTLGEIIGSSSGPIFNNAAQVFNHTFFWHSMKKDGGGEPSGKILEKVKQSFDSFQDFKATLKNAALTQFGSGWAWLVLDTSSDRLDIIKTSNAETPITNPNLKPLLTIDVWEHAYYIDYRNKRADYLDAFITKLMNWDYAEKNLLS